MPTICIGVVWGDHLTVSVHGSPGTGLRILLWVNWFVIGFQGLLTSPCIELVKRGGHRIVFRLRFEQGPVPFSPYQ